MTVYAMHSVLKSATHAATHAAALVAACVALGCAGGATTREPRPEPVPRDVSGPPTNPLAAPWVVQRTGARVEQTITVDASVHMRSFIDDSLAQLRADTVQSTMTATWSMPDAEYPRRVTGAVTMYQVRESDDSLRALDTVQLPIPFVAEQVVPTWQPHFILPNAAACGDPAAVIVQGVREVWLSLPDTLRPGQTWRDSTSHVVCRDSIPLRTDIARTFRVTSALLRDGALIVTIERRTSTTFEGAGTQFGEPVVLTGEGEGATMFEVALADGAVVFASGDSELRLTFTGRRKRQDVVQRSRISIIGR